MSSVTCVSGCNLPSRAAGDPGLKVKSVELLQQRGFEFKFRAALGENGFEFGLGLIDQFAGGGFFLFGKRAELLHERGELALRAEIGTFDLFERSESVQREARRWRLASAVRIRSNSGINAKFYEPSSETLHC